MYNRYIPNGAVYTRIPVEEEKTTSRVRPSEGSPPTDGPERAPGGLPFSIASLLGSGAGKGGGLTGLLRSLKLDRLDSGDILLLLIVLLLLWEGMTWNWSLPLAWPSSWGWGTRRRQKWNRAAAAKAATALSCYTVWSTWPSGSAKEAVAGQGIWTCP